MPLLLVAILAGCVLPEALEWTGEAGGTPSGSSSGSTGVGGANAGGSSASSTVGGGTTTGATSTTGGGGATSTTGGGGATSTTGAGAGGATTTTGAGGTGGGCPTAWCIVQFGAVSDFAQLGIAPTTAGNFLVVIVETTKMSNVTGVTDNVGNTYSIVPGTHSVHNSAGSAVDFWYAQNIASGADQITVGLTGTMYALMIWEVSGIVTSGSPIDAVGVLETGTTTTPVGAPVTTTVAGDFIVSLALLGTNSGGIFPGNEFTSDSNLRGNGWAHITSPIASAGFHQAQWSQPGGGSYCSSTAAFKAGP